jgi:hypothetical protein
MAKVKITGHASGTGVLTVTAPNTSSDRTITLPDATGTLLNSDGDGSSLTGVGVGRNIAINGAMQVAQRATSATGITGAGYQTCDRWHEYNTGNTGTFTYIQETLTSGDAYANGFQKAYRVDCTTAVASPIASAHHYVRQKFEGQDVQGFKKGTANAESYTLSFWVKSNQTGTGICALNDHDNSRYIGGTYTISSADTWEKKTITFASDATGVMTNDNGVSLDVRWWLGAGTDFTSGTLPSAWESGTNANRAVGNAITVGTSTSNDWAITGVKLEVGSSATDYEHKSFGEELRACQRYFEKSYNPDVDPGTVTSDGQVTINLSDQNTAAATWTRIPFVFKVNKRATLPTMKSYSPTSGTVAKLRDVANGADITANFETHTGTSGGTNQCTQSSANSNVHIEFHWTAESEL